MEFFILLLVLVLLVLLVLVLLALLLLVVVSGLDLTNESPDKSTMLRQGLDRKVL